MVDPVARQHAEQLLRHALTEDYQKAQVRSDFFEATAKLHGALEKSFNAALGIDTFENDGLNFREKAFQVCPGPAQQHKISDANHKRNELIHVERPFPDTEVKQLADTFARFALAAWPSLFGPHARPPAISTPNLISEPPPLKPPPPPPPPPPPRPGAWRSLFLALIFAAGGIWWTGFTIRLWQNTTDGVLLAVTAVIITLILFLLAARHTWRFLRSLTFFRAFAIVTVGGIMLFLFSSPFNNIVATSQTAENETSLGTSIRQITLSGLQRISTLGATFAKERLLSRKDGASVEESTTPSSVQTPSSPATEDMPASGAPTTTATTTRLTVGAQVRIETGGGRLRIREQPALTAPILAILENGSVVTIVGGPHEGEEFVWWEVEGYGERGWCAGDYLALIPTP